MQNVKKPPYTELRGRMWWYRRRVPDDLIRLIGRAEFRESLKTSEVEVARTRAAYRNAEVAAAFESANTQAVLEALPAVAVTELAPDELQYIRDAVRARVVDEDEAVRIARPDDDSLDAYEGIRSDEFDETSRGLRSGLLAIGPAEKRKMETLLNDIGVSIAPDSPAWHEAVYKATEGHHQALLDIRRRMNGEFNFSHPRPIMPTSLSKADVKPSSTKVDLGHVIDFHIAGLVGNHFKRKVKRCLNLFGEVVGRSTDVANLRQQDVTQFMRDICRLPAEWSRRFDAGESIEELMNSEPDKVMSPTTYEGNYRGPMSTFFKRARANFKAQGFDELSVDGIPYLGNRVADEDQQRALFDEELETLFEGDAFAVVASEPSLEPLYWLLAVMLFTGARPRELCQVNPQVDFGTLDDVWYVDLNEKSAAGAGIKKSIKTGEARRLPMHAELLRLGFPEYLERLKSQKADRLFPTWRVKGGNPFTAQYDLVSDLLKKVGLYTRNAAPSEQVTGAYVLRKTFITQCRNQGVVSKEITGHRDGSTTKVQERSYVFGLEPLSRKVNELSKLTMPVKFPMPLHTR